MWNLCTTYLICFCSEATLLHCTFLNTHHFLGIEVGYLQTTAVKGTTLKLQNYQYLLHKFFVCHTDTNSNCSMLNNACQVFQRNKKAHRIGKASLKNTNNCRLVFEIHLKLKSRGRTSRSAHILCTQLCNKNCKTDFSSGICFLNSLVEYAVKLLFADLALLQNEGIKVESGTDGHIKTSKLLSIKHHMPSLC